MKRFHLTQKLLVSLGFALSAQLAAAQAFPDRPITLVVPNPPGGLVDTSARLLSEPLARVIGQPIIVDNKPGASGNTAYQSVAKAKPDGYTLLISYSGYHVGNPALFDKLPWDPVKDFSPVALLTVSTNVIAVHPSVPVNNLKEFIAYAKANPGKLNYASQGNGSVSHIGTEIFKQTTGVEMVHVPYKGSGPAIQDVLAGQVQVFISTPPSLMQHVQSGKLKGLAVTGKNRHPGMPNVPTTAEAGLPSFQLESWVALYAPAGTPAPVINKLSDSVKQSLALPEVKDRSDAAGVELRYLNPAQMDALLKKELPYWSKAIKAANITLD
ncbi:Bug family tripartite tricarboxylate transporter substrate binding protein [Polynucleobacter alcilacus]|jgi:tripartite-type tricarboxylate transporter receptor subunit TctC|uniref:Bug family tripartite tricarboxylate transporter substrate binding protein n=1 Tax=Polynucleobacter alcilacus TaxID=1819739 RepID=UPI001C0CA9B8|nr:tripartite tricarboxylate transporter substrate binding protein [Polynucleobacter alcilacus]MBU3566701.1 tripartite tricarboxylate transporter substrate binding protein [Polynucleobacter alcilacus]